MRVFVREESVARSLRLRTVTEHLVTESDHFIQWRITALFIHLVLSRCAEAGITPLTARGEVDLGQALADAEAEVGVYVTDDEMLMLSDDERNKITERRLRRRRYAYLVLLRLTSGSIIEGG